MHITSDLTTDEWNVLVETPIMAGKAVIFSSPSGPIGLVQEGMAMANTFKDQLNQGAAASPLLGQLSQHLQAKAGQAQDIAQAWLKEIQSHDQEGRTAAEARARAIGLSRESAAILSKVPPSEATAYKQFVMSLAQRVAGAGSEGGFLGIGGTKLSEAEQSVLNDLAAALGVSSPT